MATMKKVARNRESGLSLLELIIALALTGMIAIVSYPSLSLIIRSWNSVEFGTTPSDEYAAERFIRQQIEQATLTFNKERSTRENILLFNGDISRLSFVSPMDRFSKLSGLYLTTFAIEQKATKQYITFEYRLYRENSDREPPKIEGRTIVEDISNAEIKYYSKNQGAWVTRWEDQKTLPQLVSFQFTDRAGATRRWVIAPRMANRNISVIGT